MKKLALLLAVVLGAINMNAQNLTKKFIMGQLPTTADDFQKYQFDYKLECAQDVGYDYDVYVPGYSFDGVNIFPLERNTVPIKSIECYVSDGRNTLFRLKADFTSSGKVNNYIRKIGYDAKYQFGTDSWYQLEWASVGLTPCVPNSFACWTSPKKNSKGLIVSVSTDLKYQYDSRDRVIEVDYHDGEFIYRYSYEGDSKRISTITVINNNKEVASVKYTWNSDKLSKLYCHIEYGSGFAGMYDEYEKSYKYDSHNNVSVIEYREIHGSQWNRKIYEFNNEYNSNGQLSSQNVVYRKTTAWDIERGKPEEVKTHTRSYIYDEKGNWVRMIESQGSAQWAMERKITYSNKKVGEVDINNIYDDEEVETHASFGMTLRDEFRKNGISYNGNLWPYLGNLVINLRFVVDRNGEVYFYDEPHTNKPKLDSGISNVVIPYIQNLPWIPASINGTFVKSIVSLSWRYTPTEKSYSTEILKDVVFSEKEKTIYKDNYDKILFLKTEYRANKGNVSSKKMLADMFLKGKGTDKNDIKGVELLFDLAINLDEDSRYKLCEYKDIVFRNKVMIDKLSQEYIPYCSNPNEKWNALCCEAAAISGNGKAISEIIDRYSTGNGVIADNTQVVRWLERLSDKGDTDAMIKLGDLYLNADKDVFNEAKGIEWYTKAAELGNRSAKNQLGYFYLNGIHVEKNKKLAKKILKD